jgi:hypothetical protein
MTLIVRGYDTKRDLKASVGKPLEYVKPKRGQTPFRENGVIVVAHVPDMKKRPKFYATVVMKDGLIAEVL